MNLKVERFYARWCFLRPKIQALKQIKAKQSRSNHMLVSGLTMTSQIKLTYPLLVNMKVCRLYGKQQDVDT